MSRRKIFELKVNDEIGGSRVVYVQQYLNKKEIRTFWAVGIYRNKKFKVYHSQPYPGRVLYEVKTFKRLQKAIEYIWKNTKKDCRLKPKFVLR